MKRRDFIKRSVLMSAGMSMIHFQSAWAKPKGAGSTVRVGVAGLRGRGYSFCVGRAAAEPDVIVTALCEPDPAILADRINDLQNDHGMTATGYADVRDMIADPNVDAIMIGAPTHWHALMTIWACQAGKDVFCEKPVSHNIPESRWMINAAEYANCAVQIGVQRRYAAGAVAARNFFQGGTLGAIVSIHAWWFSNRSSIGQVAPYVPGSVDFDLYMGPASDDPITRPDIHNGWHYEWRTGNGDLSNLGIHVLDMAHFICGLTNAPVRARSIGNRYNFNDSGEAPNTQLTLLDYGSFPAVVENRGLSSNADGLFRNAGCRIVCENGYIEAFDSATVYNNSDVELASGGTGGQNDIVTEFFDAVRTRDLGSLGANTASVIPANDACLAGNASYRMGSATDLATIQAACAAHSTLAADRLTSLVAHLGNESVDVNTDQLIMGPWLTFDATNAEITEVDGTTDSGPVQTANALINDTYREPFTVPAQFVPVELSEFELK